MAYCLTEAGFRVELIGPLKNQIHSINVGRYLTHKYLFGKGIIHSAIPAFLMVPALIVLNPEARKGPIYACECWA